MEVIMNREIITFTSLTTSGQQQGCDRRGGIGSTKHEYNLFGTSFADAFGTSTQPME